MGARAKVSRDGEPVKVSGPELRTLLLERYGHRCVWCSNPLKVDRCTVEHLIPKGNGGEARLLANLAPAHPGCNRKRSAIGVADWLFLCERRGRRANRPMILAALQEIAETATRQGTAGRALKELRWIRQDRPISRTLSFFTRSLPRVAMQHASRRQAAMRVLLTIIVVAVPLAVAPASVDAAAQKNVGQYLDIARAEFGSSADRCPEGVRVEFVPGAQLGTDSEGTRVVATGGWCYATINQEAYADLPWRLGCQLIVKAAGHAYGLPESQDPANVMSGYYVRYMPCLTADPVRPIERLVIRAEDLRELWKDRVYVAEERLSYYREHHVKPTAQRRARRTVRHARIERRKVQRQVRALWLRLDVVEEAYNRD